MGWDPSGSLKGPPGEGPHVYDQAEEPTSPNPGDVWLLQADDTAQAYSSPDGSTWTLSVNDLGQVSAVRLHDNRWKPESPIVVGRDSQIVVFLPYGYDRVNSWLFTIYDFQNNILSQAQVGQEYGNVRDYIVVDWNVINGETYRVTLSSYVWYVQGRESDPVEVVPNPPTEITTVVKQPQDITVTELGGTQGAIFRTSVVSSEQPDFRWQHSTDNGATWTDGVQGGDGDVLGGSDGVVFEYVTPNMWISSDMNNWLVRCILTDSSGEIVTDSARLTVNV